MSSNVRLPAAQQFGWRLGSLLGLLLIWQLSALWVASDELPPPAQVWQSLSVEWHSGDLQLHISATLRRVVAAFLVAMLLGTALGMLMGSSRRADALLDSWLLIALNIPALVVIILCYLWLGLSDTAAVIAVALNKIPTVIVTVREGARAIDRELLDVGRAFRLSRSKRFWRIYLPQLSPYLMAAARSGLSLIWKIVLVVELMGRSDGVGFQLGVFFQFFDIASILAYTLAFGAIILSIEYLLVQPLERRANRWRQHG